MPQKKSTRYPSNTLEQARQVTAAWAEAAGLQLPNLTAAQFQEQVAAAADKATAVERLRVEVTKAIEVRDAALNEVWDLTRRVRNAAKAIYGDDSQEMRKFGLEPVRGRRGAAGQEPAAS